MHLSKEFNVGRATIHDIKQSKAKIEEFFKNNESSSSVGNILRTGEFPQIEDRSTRGLFKTNRHSRQVRDCWISSKVILDFVCYPSLKKKNCHVM